MHVPLLLLQPVSTDFGQYNSYGDVSGGVRGKAFYIPLHYGERIAMIAHVCCFIIRLCICFVCAKWF